jgi:hypothetical protein
VNGPGPAVTGHMAMPADGTAYTVDGPLTGRPADLRLMRSYPCEALCSCGEMIRCDSLQAAGWSHTGRKPAEE